MRKKSSAIILLLSIYSQQAFSNELIDKNIPPIHNKEKNNTPPGVFVFLTEDNEKKEIITKRYISSKIDKNNNLTIHITDEISENLDKHLKSTQPKYQSDLSSNFAYIIPSYNNAVKKEIINYLNSIITDKLNPDANLSQPYSTNEPDIENVYIKIKNNNDLLSDIENNKIRPFTNDEIAKIESEIRKKTNSPISKSIINHNNRINEHENKIGANIGAIYKILDITNTNTHNINDATNSIVENNTNIKINHNRITENEKNIKVNSNRTNENKNSIDRIDSLAAEYFSEFGILDSERKDIKGHFQRLYIENSVNRGDINHLANDLKHFKSETNNRFYKVEKRANQGIASVAAMSNLPFTDTATFSTAIGIGNYRNATALAWGMQYRINENVKVRASSAWNDSNSFVSAGGIGISW